MSVRLHVNTIHADIRRRGWVYLIYCVRVCTAVQQDPHHFFAVYSSRTHGTQCRVPLLRELHNEIREGGEDARGPVEQRRRETSGGVWSHLKGSCWWSARGAGNPTQGTCILRETPGIQSTPLPHQARWDPLQIGGRAERSRRCLSHRPPSRRSVDPTALRHIISTDETVDWKTVLHVPTIRPHTLPEPTNQPDSLEIITPPPLPPDPGRADSSRCAGAPPPPRQNPMRSRGTTRDPLLPPVLPAPPALRRPSNRTT